MQNVVSGISTDRTSANSKNTEFNSASGVTGIVTKVEAQSAGLCVGNFVKIWINDVAQSISYARGINTYWLDSSFKVRLQFMSLS